SDAHRPALDPARQLGGVAGLADQVDVVALDRELADPELAPPTAEDERPPKHLAQLEPAEPGDVAANPLGDMDREARREGGALPVTEPRASGVCRLAAGTLAHTTVGPELHLLLSSCTSHLIEHSL